MDWRIGRVLRSQYSRVAMVAAGNLIVPQNPARVGLIFPLGGDDGGNPIKPGSIPTSATDGFFQSAEIPLKLTIAADGDLPTLAWYGLGTAVTGSFCPVIEIFCPLQFLDIGLREFQRQYGVQ